MKRALFLVLAIVFTLSLVSDSVARAEPKNHDKKLSAFLNDLADKFEKDGENAAREQARLHGLKVRGGGLVPVILEPKSGQNSSSIDPDRVEQLGGRVDATSSCSAE